jgi:DNA repair exonuclease SbcCD ATPase subunit
MERQAAEADGISNLLTRVQEAEKQLKQHDAQIEAEEVRYRQLVQQQTGFNDGTDPLSKQAIELQLAALQREEFSELLRKAHATPRPEDDVIVAQLQQLQQQQSQIGAEIQSINQFLQQQQRNLAELEELRRRYRQNGYDAYNSSFPADFALGSLLGQLLGGLMNSDLIWRELGRHQHRRGQSSGDWGGFGGGFGDSGGDTGSFGGGEFRTGGGF